MWTRDSTARLHLLHLPMVLLHLARFHPPWPPHPCRLFDSRSIPSCPPCSPPSCCLRRFLREPPHIRCASCAGAETSNCSRRCSTPSAPSSSTLNPSLCHAQTRRNLAHSNTTSSKTYKPPSMTHAAHTPSSSSPPFDLQQRCKTLRTDNTQVLKHRQRQDPRSLSRLAWASGSGSTRCVSFCTFVPVKQAN